MNKLLNITMSSLHIKMNSELLMKACTEIVMVNGRPLSILKDSLLMQMMELSTKIII